MRLELPISSGRNYAMPLSLPDGNGAQLCPQNRDPLSAASYLTVGRNYALPIYERKPCLRTIYRQDSKLELPVQKLDPADLQPQPFNMFKQLCAAFILVWCGLAGGHHHFHTNRCLNSLGKFPFDEQKFSGEWFVVARVFRPNKMPGKVTCDKLHYTAEMDGNLTRTHIDVHLNLDDGSNSVWEGKGQAIKPGFASVTAMAWKNTKDDKWHSVLKHTILSTDYDSYALVHACKENYDDKDDSFTKFVFDQIWSRTKAMDAGLLKTLKSVMSSLDIEEDEWDDVGNETC
ncbi:apolipoprotein D-like [Periplaneta americana]|uniref:apolipoprotein D-like n=1 Tax=Periplaneta americana TaxID=6978 RepID=UPI0037E9BBEF